MTSFYSGTQINIQALAETLDQLPSTKDEVAKVTNYLNASASDIHTGLEATEAAVKQAPLDQYRIGYLPPMPSLPAISKPLPKPKQNRHWC